MDWFNKIYVVVPTESDNFEPKEPANNAATMDKWEGEDEEEDVKVRNLFPGLLDVFVTLLKWTKRSGTLAYIFRGCKRDIVVCCDAQAILTSS